jgi:hypothetical protein
MVRVLEFGAEKYSPDNWKKGLEMNEILESALRHMIALMSGETHDKESGELHSGHIMCNLMFWQHFYDKQNINDNDTIHDYSPDNGIRISPTTRVFSVGYTGGLDKGAGTTAMVY